MQKRSLCSVSWLMQNRYLPLRNRMSCVNNATVSLRPKTLPRKLTSLPSSMLSIVVSAAWLSGRRCLGGFIGCSVSSLGAVELSFFDWALMLVVVAAAEVEGCAPLFSADMATLNSFSMICCKSLCCRWCTEIRKKLCARKQRKYLIKKESAFGY